MTKAITVDTILEALNDFSEAVGFNGERKTLDENIVEFNITREDWNRALTLCYGDRNKGMSCRSLNDWWNKFISMGYILVDKEDNQYFLELEEIRKAKHLLSEYYNNKKSWMS